MQQQPLLLCKDNLVGELEDLQKQRRPELGQLVQRVGRQHLQQQKQQPLHLEDVQLPRLTWGQIIVSWLEQAACSSVLSTSRNSISFTCPKGARNTTRGACVVCLLR